MATTYYSRPPPAPPSASSATSASNSSISAKYESHAVSRSAELLSCARSSLKLLQSQPVTPATEWLQPITPQQLQLHSQHSPSSDAELDSLLEDGLSLLREMKTGLVKLQSLVRRRGHTNDPTNDIASVMRQFETDAKELSDLIPSISSRRRHNAQTKKHLDFVASWLQAVAAQQTQELKDLLKVRGNVLADQAQRRKLLHPSNQQSKSSTATSSSARTGSTKKGPHDTPWDSPLFTMTANAPAPPVNPTASTANGGGGTTSAPSSSAANGTAAKTSTNPYQRSASAGYGGGGYNYQTAGYGGGGYGGASYGGGTGMRQRRPNPSSSFPTSNMHHQQQEDDADRVQSQIQQRQQIRENKSRVAQAQQAERSLADLSVLFGKMSNLIVSQGEILEKVEDDVEAALVDVTAGQEEIQTLYSLKKGNRALIIKVFAVLIFFILFMRLY